MAITTWTIDPSHSSIRFAVRHLVIAKVHGTFERWTGAVTGDEADPSTWQVDVHIDATSISTRDEKRDAHLRSADFFDAERFPELVFRSTKVTKLDDEHVSIEAALTIHGVTRPVSLDAELLGRTKDPWGNDRIGFAAKTSVDRREFGLTWNQALETGGVVVGDKVEIELDLEAIKAQPAVVAA